MEWIDESLIAGRIVKRRKELNLSQAKVAGEIGTNQSNYAPYESGKKIPSLQTLAKIAAVLKTSIDYLYNGGDPLSSPVGVSEGQRTVNYFVYLVKNKVISRNYSNNVKHPELLIDIHKEILLNLYENLEKLEADKGSFGDSYEMMVESYKKSAANKIDDSLKKKALAESQIVRIF